MNIYVNKNFKTLFVDFQNYIYSWDANMLLKLHVNFCNIITVNVIQAGTILLKKKLSNFLPQPENFVHYYTKESN